MNHVDIILEAEYGNRFYSIGRDTGRTYIEKLEWAVLWEAGTGFKKKADRETDSLQ
jgi:hypothetical protein